MENSFLEMKGIDKRFPGTHALKEVNFDLRRGEVHALIGPNGSGKSTLMNILVGGLAADKGTIEINGKRAAIHSPLQARKHGVSMIHQEYKLFPDLTVAENIYFGRHPTTKGRLIDWTTMMRQAQAQISRVGKGVHAADLVGGLSVAKQQMVEIAKALSYQSDVVIMDEPTAALTGEEAENLFKIIRAIKASGISVVYISHRLDEVLEISDRITVLRDGVMIRSMENHSITKDMLVEFMTEKKPSAFKLSEAKETKVGQPVMQVKGLCLPGKLENVSLDLYPGEVLGIAGLVGAGRTELLKSIFGELKPTAGNISLHGKPARIGSSVNAVKNRIALVPEDRKKEGVVMPMSIADNMILANFRRFRRGFVISNKEQLGVAGDMVKALRLKCSSVRSPARNLSGGNQQKVVIAKWLIADSNIILMDEPTRGIDVGAKEEIYNLIRQLAAEGKSILFVSSELEEVQRVSDRIVVMRAGRIVAELARNAEIEEMMSHAT